MLQGFEQKNEQKSHYKMKINKDFTEAHKLSRKPETLAAFARRRTQQQQQMKKELKTETTKETVRYLKPDAVHPWHSRHLQPSYAGHNRCVLTMNSSLQQPKRSQIDPPLYLARQKRKSRRCPFLCATITPT
jgi:hypothetical protein